MLKKIRKFFKSKAGNITIIAIVLIPALLLTFSSTVATTRRKNVQKTEVLISVDSFCDYVNEKYGKILKINNNEVCGYSQSGQDEIKTYFADYFVHIDGYNSKWTYTLNFVSDDIQNTSFTVLCDIYFPKISTSMSVVNYWGQYTGTDSIGEGWYSSHKAVMQTLYDDFSPRESNNSWVYERIEVISSCV